MWIEGPPIKEWQGLPVYYDLTIQELPFREDARKHKENISLRLDLPGELSLPFLPYVKNLTPCNESANNDLQEAYAQKAIAKGFYNELYPYVNYTISVKACTAVGCGMDSSPFRFTTDEEVPECPPRVQSLEAASSTSLNMTWLPPLRICRNGRMVNYSITVFENWSLKEIGTFYTSSLTYEITSLNKYAKYCARVQAATYKGFGNASEEKCRRTEEDGKIV